MFFRIVLVVSFVGLSQARAQAPFEGDITMQGGANGQEMTAVAHVKGSHIEMDAAHTIMGDSKIFIDTRLQKITVTMGSHAMQHDYDNDTMNVDLKSTGNHKTIASYNADEYVLTTKKGKKTVYWAAPGVSHDVAFNMVQILFNNSPSGARRGANVLLGRGLAVLRTEMQYYIMGHDITAWAEFVKSEPKKIDDALLKVPDDLSIVPVTEGMKPQDE